MKFGVNSRVRNAQVRSGMILWGADGMRISKTHINLVRDLTRESTGMDKLIESIFKVLKAQQMSIDKLGEGLILYKEIIMELRREIENLKKAK